MEQLDENKRCIASLLQRQYLEEGEAIFSYINTIIGYYDPETGIIMDDQAREYFSLNTIEAFYDSKPYVCGNIINLDEAYKKYTDGQTTEIQDLFDAFDFEESKYFYLGEIDEEGDITFLKIDYSDTLYNYKQQVKKNLATKNKDNNTIAKKDIEKKIEENKYTKEELKKLKKDLKDSTPKSEFINNKGIIDVNGLYKKVTKTLIAQDEPVRRMIIEIARMQLDDNQRYGILLTGNTGVGKTELMKLISENIKRPFLTIDTTQLTSPGYEGKNIEQCLWELYELCGRDIKAAEKAIIFFDEIDKKGSARKDDVGGKAVLNVLLKFLDGTKYHATASSQGLGSMNGINIDTSKMLVIAGGAFTDVYKHEDKATIGFSTQKDKQKYEPTIDDFVEKGMMTDEFMGRMPIIIRLNDLNQKSMIEILKKSDKSPIKIQKNKFKQLGVNLKFTGKALDGIVDKAVQRKTGARGLAGIVSNVTYKPFDYAITNMGVAEEILITDETIKDINKFVVKQKKKKISKN